MVPGTRTSPERMARCISSISELQLKLFKHSIQITVGSLPGKAQFPGNSRYILALGDQHLDTELRRRSSCHHSQLSQLVYLLLVSDESCQTLTRSHYFLMKFRWLCLKSNTYNTVPDRQTGQFDIISNTELFIQAVTICADRL